MARLPAPSVASGLRDHLGKMPKNQVVAEVEGIPVSELSHAVVSVAKVQERTQAILTWLTNHAETNAGHLHFTNTDLAQAAGWSRPLTGRSLSAASDRHRVTGVG